MSTEQNRFLQAAKKFDRRRSREKKICSTDFEEQTMQEANISGSGRTGRAKQLSEEGLNCYRRAYVCRSVVRNAWYWRPALMRKAMHCPSVDDEL